MESKPKQTTASSAFKNDDHWGFLDEIEAPMWADLSLCDLANDDNDDSWFDTCHEFHQRASSHLISKVFHTKNSINIQEPPSPKLPASVSKSRGKSYKVKNWGQKKGKTVSNQQGPVKNLTKKSAGSKGSSNKAKPVSNTAKSRENGGPKPCSSSESGLTDNSRPKLLKSRSTSLVSGVSDNSRPKLTKSRSSSLTSGVTENSRPKLSKSGSSSLATDVTDISRPKLSKLRSNSLASGDTGDSMAKLAKSRSSSLASGLTDSSSMSNLTSDHGEPQVKKSMEVACQTSEFLSLLRLNVRKSCATRPAARVVASSGTRSEDSKSSLGKSSVDSPLDQGSSDKKVVAGDGISVMRVSQPPKNKTKAANVTKATGLDARSVPDRQLASKATDKGKVQRSKSLGKVMMPRKVNEQNQMISKETKKVGVGGRTASLASIKETTSARTATSQKTKSSDKVAQPVGNVQRASKQSVAQKNGTKKPIGLKQEKTNNGKKDKDTVNPARKIYFR
nr:IQ motif, EF-hand binding site, P-loop containing nucleoside triphosphate hydrolase [Tanacetum cinerariifolium]